MNDDLNEVGIDSPVRPGPKKLMSSYLMKVERQSRAASNEQNIVQSALNP